MAADKGIGGGVMLLGTIRDVVISLCWIGPGDRVGIGEEDRMITSAVLAIVASRVFRDLP